jgi:hypothetical protein
VHSPKWSNGNAPFSGASGFPARNCGVDISFTRACPDFSRFFPVVDYMRLLISSFASSVTSSSFVLLLLLKVRFPGKKVDEKVKKLAAKFYDLRHKKRDQSHLSRAIVPTRD